MEINEFVYYQYVYIEYKSNKREFYELKINKINGIDLLDNEEILKGEFFKEKIIKLSFKITTDFIKNIENKNDNSIIIQCLVKNITKKIIIEISDQLSVKQELKICYKIENPKEAKELNNIIYNNKIKTNLNIIYTGFIQDTIYYINYRDKKIINLYDGVIEIVSFEPNEQKIKIIKNNHFDNKNGTIILFFGIINLLDWFPIPIKDIMHFEVWYNYYKDNSFQENKKTILEDFKNYYNEIEPDLYSFANIIFLIKKIDPNNIKEIINPLFPFLKEDEINELIKTILSIINYSKEVKNKKDLDDLNEMKIVFLFQIYEIFLKKYKELEKEAFKVDLINKFENQNLNKYKKECKLKYFILDNENEKKYLSQKNNIIKEEKDANIYYKISENEEPVLVDKDKIIKKKANSINKSRISDSAGNDINIENYQFIQESNSIQENDFYNLNNFFKKLIDEVLLLPLLIKGAINNNDINTLDKCNNSFNYMHYIYSIFKEENHSIFAEKINKFKIYFIDLCWTLNKANIDFNNYPSIATKLNAKISNKNNNFIELKIKKIDRIIDNDWYIMKNDIYNEIFSFEEQIIDQNEYIYT